MNESGFLFVAKQELKKEKDRIWDSIKKEVGKEVECVPEVKGLVDGLFRTVIVEGDKEVSLEDFVAKDLPDRSEEILVRLTCKIKDLEHEVSLVKLRNEVLLLENEKFRKMKKVLEEE